MVFWQVDGFHKPGTDYSCPGEIITGVFSHVFVKKEDGWKITASQNTLSR